MVSKKQAVDSALNGLDFLVRPQVADEDNANFGRLANLAAFRISKKEEYLSAAKCFLNRMLLIQRKDGGFGPEEYSVPSAGGSVLIELMAAKRLGFSIASKAQLNKVAQYILDLQINEPDSPAHGAFRGYDSNYKLGNCSNCRTDVYSIMGLLRYADISDSYYFFDAKGAGKISK